MGLICNLMPQFTPSPSTCPRVKSIMLMSFEGTTATTMDSQEPTCCSLVLRPHPTRRRGLAGVTSPNPWASSRSVKRPIKSQSSNNAEVRTSTQSYRAKHVMRFIKQGFNTSTSPRIQACDTRLFPCRRVGSGHARLHLL